MNRRFAATLLCLLAASACTDPEIVPVPYRPTDARDAYRYSLDVAGLGATALADEWASAGEEALAQAVDVTVPYREEGLFDSRQAHASAYRLQVRRGQRVVVALEFDGAPAPRVFVDAFHTSEPEARHVASNDPTDNLLVFEPNRDGTYLVRVQPELLRGSRFTLEIRLQASLEFPVADAGMSDMWSAFGVERDGGARSHHGVDIFAPRNTAVLAATRAQVRRVGEQGRGGNVIWLYDQTRSLNLYYAHLESQEVEEGTWVEPGQVIGRVGNSGNARTTPPHLHFGVYVRGAGPVDPDPFLRPTSSRFTPIRADTTVVGAFTASRENSISIRGRASTRADALRLLAPGTPLRVWAAVGDWYRVALEDGLNGYVRAADLPAQVSSAGG